MKIQDLIDSKNSNLFQKISEYYEIFLNESADWRLEVWSFSIQEKNVLIQYNSNYICDFPSSYFTLILLQLELQIDGFKPIYFGLSLDKKNQEVSQIAVKNLNYYFPKFKLLSRFLELNYPLEEYYVFQKEDQLQDVKIEFITNELNHKNSSLFSISLLYLSFLELIKSTDYSDNGKLRQQFMEYGNGCFSELYSAIDVIITQWITDENSNVELYMKDLLLQIGFTNSWFSYKADLPGVIENEFPNCGFFVAEKFVLI